MEKKIENEMETGVSIGDYRDKSFPKLGLPTIMENQMEKMENEMETGVI